MAFLFNFLNFSFIHFYYLFIHLFVIFYSDIKTTKQWCSQGQGLNPQDQGLNPQGLNLQAVMQSRPRPQPSRPRPQPSRPTPQPPRPRSQPSRPQPSSSDAVKAKASPSRPQPPRPRPQPTRPQPSSSDAVKAKSSTLKASTPKAKASTLKASTFKQWCSQGQVLNPQGINPQGQGLNLQGQSEGIGQTNWPRGQNTSLLPGNKSQWRKWFNENLDLSATTEQRWQVPLLTPSMTWRSWRELNSNHHATKLTLYWHIKTAEQQTIIQQYGDWYKGRWWVGCYIWYSEKGPGWAAAPTSPLLAVPNVTAYPSMPSVPTSYYLMWPYNKLLLRSKGLTIITDFISK